MSGRPAIPARGPGEPERSPALLALAGSSEGGTQCLALQGELDHATAPQLRPQLQRLAPHGSELILDLSGLRFIDSVGVRALLENRQVHGCTLIFVEPRGQVRDVLGRLGLLDRLGDPDGEAA